jgi:hypothetical protein
VVELLWKQVDANRPVRRENHIFAISNRMLMS